MLLMIAAWFTAVIAFGFLWFGAASYSSYRGMRNNPKYDSKVLLTLFLVHGVIASAGFVGSAGLVIWLVGKTV